MGEPLERVCAQFGAEQTIERSRLVAILKELDGACFTDEVLEHLLASAGMRSASSIRIRDFFGSIFRSQQGPTAETKIFFCRHGETDWNLAHKLQGLTDIPLNNAGREQAQCIAEALKPKQLAAVWTSPLLRARDTAAAVASAVGLELRVDERLRERNLGVMEGRTGQQVEAEFPAVWAAWKALEALPPEGEAEPEAEVVQRVEAAMFDIAATYPGRTVAMVAHGAVLRCLCRKTFGNASISTFSVGPGRAWRPLALDDGSHLKTPGLKV